MVNVPDISAGTPLDTAKQRLTEAGLNYDVKSFSGGASAVLAISPGAGVSVRVGSTVTIYAI
jgi:beta-lactam-binding protein with PASTA domain